ncbi:MAG TPA: carboxypeptidase-like regulatory domain-containing protein [Bryobacteraceae bacterium]|nr:carboxypeptidase-like regulatory domain-containing protein [Bryobacteraceae bacterium]
MKILRVSFSLLFLSLSGLAQSDRGTVTGTVSDPAGAVVANAPIQAKHLETGAVYEAATSATGNYTLSQLPTGTYELTVSVEGFKKFVRQNLALPVAQTLRIDAKLEVGSNAESVTVTEAAPLLKTESGDLSHNVSVNTMNSLPVLGIGTTASTAGIRNPYAVMQLLPGSSWTPDVNMRLNGLPSNTEAMRIEGQDATNGLIDTQSMTQPSVDAIQEFAVETSNFAAEFGQVGGGYFNVTMRSGTNQFHGSGYEYFVNEALNAGTPFTNDGNGHLLRPRQRRNDYGFTLGGPIWIPKVFNGHDKAFFFVNFEQYRETTINNNTPITVPTLNYRAGNFTQALTGKNLCPAANQGCDPLGRSIMENTIYDPLTQRIAANGQTVRDPFPNNSIPLTQQDPVALAVQKMIPLPTSTALTSNYLTTYANPRLTYIPSVKIDYQLSSKSKISGYWSRTYTDTPNNSALPFPLKATTGSNIVAHTIRLNFDQTLTPTLLAHVGAGLVYLLDNVEAGAYDPVAGIGLKGTYTNIFPSIQGLCTSAAGVCTGQGGSNSMGPGSIAKIWNTKPTANASVTWVRSNHTYKFGGELILEGYPAYNQTYANAWILFSAVESGLPSTNGQSLAGGSVGFPYASFLLGAVDNGFVGLPSKSRMGSHSFSWFVQDSWKATRKLTLDYGLRYDFQTYLKEEHGRIPYFSASTPNASVGGRLGAVAFDGYDPGHCQCDIAHNYPWAYGPRLGVAYQVLPKTVIRAGAGISYFKTDDNGLNSFSTGSQYIYTAPTYGSPAYTLASGVPYQLVWPNLNPGQVPLPGTIASPSQQIDPHAGRPARIVQWSFGVQREVARNIVAEATYVGNRGAYWNSAYIICPNCIDQGILTHYGLSLNNSADLTLLGSPVNSSTAIQRGFGLAYAGFPATASVAQSLRPFPQFSNITNMHWAPDGDSWYDALQTKVTKRLSHGLDLQSSFTWSKAFAAGTEADISTLSPVTPATNDVFNRPQNKYISGLDQPFLWVFAGNYITPHTSGHRFLGNKAVSWIVRDWQVGAVLRYGSGLPTLSPIATNGLAALLFRNTGATGTTGGTFMNRNPGVPLYTVDLNCHCYDPNKTFVLNPAAWSNPLPGQWGTAAGYYSDYRYQRRPAESMSLGRTFRIKEGMNLQIRAEFTNIFNRTEANNPTSTNGLATQTCAGPTGAAVPCSGVYTKTTGGFGYINTAPTATTIAPRSGQLVARFQF